MDAGDFRVGEPDATDASDGTMNSSACRCQPFLEALDDRVLVCDGAMGTQLYAKGVFINRCFESLNLTEPDLVGSVHAEYLRAGADVIETNTFGANRIKLRAFGLSEKVAAINLEGARLARDGGRATSGNGADAPTSPARSARSAFASSRGARPASTKRSSISREQAEALAEGGVDLFILETFRDLNEIGAAIAAVRRVCDLPIVAQMTTEEDGNSLDGTPPEQFAPVLLGARRRRRRRQLQRRAGADARVDRAARRA